MTLAIDIDNLTEPSEGDAIEVEVRPATVLIPVPIPTPDEALTRARAVCMASGFYPLTPAEHERFARLEKDVRHLESVGRAYQETAVDRAERIRELEAEVERLRQPELPAPDPGLALALMARAAREIGEPVTRAAWVADVEAAFPGFAAMLPEHMRPRRG